MKTLDKIEMILTERLKDTWAGKFQIHSETLSNFLKTFNSDVLEFEMELRRMGDNPDLTKIRRLLTNLQKANDEIRRILVTVAKAKGL